MMGLLSSRTIMEKSVDDYDDEYNLQDIQLYSTYGFDEHDISALKSQEFVDKTFATKMVDAYSESDDGTVAITRIEESDRNVNRFQLVEGKMPEKANEILVLGTSLNSEHYKIGGKLRFFLDDGDIKENLKNTEYTITGFVKAPAYMAKTLGTSNLKNLDLGLIVYAPKENFISEYYTSIYFTAKGARPLDTFSQEYESHLDEIRGETEFFAKKQQDNLKGKILKKYEKEIKDGEAELEKERTKGEEQLEDAREQLDEAKMKIVAGESQVQSLQAVLDEATARQRSLVGKYSDAAKSVARINQIVREDKEGRSFDEIYTQLVTDYGTYEAMTQLAKSLDSANIEESLKETESQAAGVKKRLDELEKELNEKLDELEKLETPTIPIPTPQGGEGRDFDPSKIEMPEIELPEMEIPEVELPKIVLPDNLPEIEIPNAELPQEVQGALENAKQAVEGARKALSQAESQLPEEGTALLTQARESLEKAMESLTGEMSSPELSEEAKDALSKARENLESAMDSLGTSQETLEKAAADYETRLKEAEEKAKAEYDARVKEAEEKAKAEYEERVKEAQEKAKEAADAAPKEVEIPIVDEETRAKITERIAEIRSEMDELRGELNVYETLAETYRDLKEQALNQLDSPKAQVEELNEKYGGDIAAAFKEYNKLQQDRLVNEALNREVEAAEKVISDAQTSINQAKKEVEDGKIAFAEGEEELRRNEMKFQLEIDKAEAEIKKARQDLEALPEAEWIILDRESHYSTYMYKNNAAQMGAIGISLPILFYLVAALVCMTTMTRLVEEQRGQIGVLRALGFSKFQIVGKYVTYALTATIIGTALGIVMGMAIFPTVIYTTWRLMYDLPEADYSFPIMNVAICFISFAVVMALVTIIVVRSILKEAPSQLMRPKAPKNAKRIFLEKIHPIWWRLSFTSKITARNLMRYKSRFIMTVIGVAGCTGLLILGWGIKDSIADIVHLQYGEIFNFNHTVNLEEEADADRFEEILSKDLENEYVVPVLTYVSKVYVSKDEPTISVTVGDARKLNEVFLLKSKPGFNEIKIKNSGVIVSEKFAKNNGIKAGDKITIESHYGVKGEVRVDAICEMYFQHYLYISQESYENLFGETVKANTILVKNEGGDAFKKDIEKLRGFESVVDFEPMIEQFNNMIKALDFIILVIILTAGALAFVVLMNLTQVNISERVREIATLKVLGFRKAEVDSYIFKEVMLLSAIGGLVGIPLGILEHRFIMNIINMDMIMFGQNIKLLSFLYAYGLTMLFTVIVLLLTKKSLRRIAMVDSLKSVE